MFSRMSITTQFALVFLVALGLIGGASWLILDRIYLTPVEEPGRNGRGQRRRVRQLGGAVWPRLGPRRRPQLPGPPRPVPARGHDRDAAQGHRSQFLFEESGAGAARIFGGRRALGVAVQVPPDVAQRDESRTTSPTRSRTARCAASATAASRNTTSCCPGAFATREPSITRRRASSATATPMRRPTTSRSATERRTASASRRAMSPGSSACAFPRARSGTWRRRSSASGSC